MILIPIPIPRMGKAKEKEKGAGRVSRMNCVLFLRDALVPGSVRCLLNALLSVSRSLSFFLTLLLCGSDCVVLFKTLYR